MEKNNNCCSNLDCEKPGQQLTTVSPSSASGLPLSPCLATMTTKTTTTTTTTTITEHNFLVPELLVISPRLDTPLNSNTSTTTLSSSFTQPIIMVDTNPEATPTEPSPPSSSDFIIDSSNIIEKPIPIPSNQQIIGENSNPSSSQNTNTPNPVIFKTTSSTSTTTTSHTVTTPALENRGVSTSPPNTPLMDECQIELSGRGSSTMSKSPPLQSTCVMMMDSDKEKLSAVELAIPSGSTSLPSSPAAPQIQVQGAPSNGSRKSHRTTSVPLIRNRIQRPIRQKSPAMGERPLLHAVLVQEEIKTLINQEDINMRDSNGNSILHRVSIIGSMLAIRHMVLRGARVNSTNNSGMTPLHYAACSNQQSVEILLYYGSLPNSKDNNRETPLYYAVDRGQYSIVSLLLSRGSKVSTTNKSMSRNSIHVAALKGYSNILRLLLDYKCNINAVDNNGSSPFHLCVYHSPSAQNPINYCSNQSANNIDAYMSCCESLLQKGATLTLQDNQGYTPIHIASRQGKKNIIDLILFYCKQQKNKSGQAVSIPNASKFKKELKSEIVLYIPDNKGRLPLHSAALGGHSRVLESLLGTGKKCTTVRDDMGMTPLCLASLFGHFDCVEYLYNLDPKLNQQCRFYTSSSIDCSKTPIDPLGNDFRFALDGDYCDLVFIIEGRDIFAHSIMLRQFKFFRDLIASSKSSASLHPHATNNGVHGSHQHLHSHQYGGIYGSQYSYNNSYISRSHDDSSIHYHSSMMDGYDDDYSAMEYISANVNIGSGVETSRARTRTRMNSVVNPSTLTRIPIEKGISYEIFRAIMQFAYTSEIPREIIATTGKLSQLLDFANQFDMESLGNLCVDTLSQHSAGRLGTLEMSKYLLKQINSKQSADVTIIYDGGQVVLAHSVILANRSTFFKLHFESYPVLSRSSIPLFPNGVANISSSLSSSYGNGSTSTPLRKASAPSSPAFSDIPTMGWVIDIGEASQKAVFVMLEYLYSGCIPSGNSAMQPSLYPLLSHKPSPTEMDVIDMLLLAKLAYALNLPVLQQFSAVLLYNILDPLKLVTIIRTLFTFDGNVGWGRTTSLEPMWGVCLEWLTKKCNWEEVNRCESFLALGPKYLKDIKKERKEKKKKQKASGKMPSKSKLNVSSAAATSTTTTTSNQYVDSPSSSNMKREDKGGLTWSRKMHPKEIFRSVSSGFLSNSSNSSNNNNSNGNSSSFSVATPSSPTQETASTSAPSSPKSIGNDGNDTIANSNGANSENQNKDEDTPKLSKQNSISNFLSKKKVWSTFSRKPITNRSKSFVV